MFADHSWAGIQIKVDWWPMMMMMIRINRKWTMPIWFCGGDKNENVVQGIKLFLRWYANQARIKMRS